MDNVYWQSEDSRTEIRLEKTDQPDLMQISVLVSREELSPISDFMRRMGIVERLAALAKVVFGNKLAVGPDAPFCGPENIDRSAITVAEMWHAVTDDQYMFTFVGVLSPEFTPQMLMLEAPDAALV